MRLDKFLKVSRIIKRRTVANEACSSSRVKVNGKAAKPSYDLKIGDVVEISFGDNPLKFEVLLLSEHMPKEKTDTMYKIIG